MKGTEEIGCCGAYCKTCREFEKTCKGCKPGYLDGSRGLSRRCEIIQVFINHPGYKYGKYKQALEFIHAYDYAAFMKAAENWKNAYGKYTEQDN